MAPKTAWALRNRHLFPIGVNRAGRATLLRVPGLGVGSVDKILRARRLGALRQVDLGRMHVPMRRAKFFVTCADGSSSAHKLDSLGLAELIATGHKQLDLFASAQVAQSGQL